VNTVRKLIKGILIFSLVCLVVTMPVEAAMSAVMNSVTRSDCVITINVTVGDGGTYYLQIYDDSVLLEATPFTATTGQTLDVHYTIKQFVAGGAPGIGIAIADGPTDGATLFDFLDPFIYPDEVAAECAAAFTASGGCQLVIPEGSIVGDLPFATRAYWAPGKITPEVTLNPGTYWVVAQEPDDAGNFFYKLVLACQFVYVPVNVMQPSYLFPWSGQALPPPSNIEQ
jgi:hypothetical protein